MECFRRAMLPGVPVDAGIRWLGKAVALSRMMMEMMRTLHQCQAAAPVAQPQPQVAAQPVVQPAVSPPSAAAEAARRAGAIPAQPAGTEASAQGLGTKDPMSSESRSPTPAAAAVTARPAPAAPSLSALPPRPGVRADLLASTSQASGVLAAAA